MTKIFVMNYNDLHNGLGKYETAKIMDAMKKNPEISDDGIMLIPFTPTRSAKFHVHSTTTTWTRVEYVGAVE